MQSKRKRAWLTPDSGEALADLICRRFFVPDTPAFRESVSGALLELTYSWNWEQFGTMTPDEAAAVMLTMYNRYALDDSCTEETVEAPYWDEDSADDADDTAPIDDQPWYGQLLTDGFTWQEQLSVWIVTAFVAYAATPAAAIAFLPIANRFVLEFKKHDLGGIVRVLVDAVEVGRVDTYSATPGVIEMPVVALPSGGMGSEEMFPTLIIAMADEYNPLITGTPNIQVIRKRLTPDEITPRDLRYNPDTNTVQRTWDDGETWVDQPAADPRHADVFRRPARTDDNARCNAAQGMSDYVRHTLSNWIEAATLAQAATGVLEILLLLAGGAGIIFDLIILALETLATIGEATIEAAFTDTVYDDITCAFYCHVGADGQLSASGLADVLADLNVTHAGTVYNVVSVIANMAGEVLLSNAGVESTATGDCTACDCCIDPTTEGVPTANFPAIPVGIFLSYNQVIGQGGLWYADAEGVGGTWTMTLEHAVEIRRVAFNCNSYGGATFTVTIGTQSTSLGYGGTPEWILDTPQVTDTIVCVQHDIPSNIRLSFNGFGVTYCEPS